MVAPEGVLGRLFADPSLACSTCRVASLIRMLSHGVGGYRNPRREPEVPRDAEREDERNSFFFPEREIQTCRPQIRRDDPLNLSI